MRERERDTEKIRGTILAKENCSANMFVKIGPSILAISFERTFFWEISFVADSLIEYMFALKT